MRPLLAFLLLASSCFGQIKLTQETSQTWVGFQNPQIVNGVVIAGPDSKPTLSNTTMTIKVETAVEYKFAQLKATRLPTLERITLEQVEGGWRFKPSAPAGLYAVEYLAFDPTHGIASEEIQVEIKPEKPEPIRPEPIPGNEFSEVVEKAIAELRSGYGQAFRQVADGIDRREILLDSRYHSFLLPLTTQARVTALTGVDQLLQNKLPRNGVNLLPEAAGFSRSLADAFDGGRQ